MSLGEDKELTLTLFPDLTRTKEKRIYMQEIRKTLGTFYRKCVLA